MTDVGREAVEMQAIHTRTYRSSQTPQRSGAEQGRRAHRSGTVAILETALIGVFAVAIVLAGALYLQPADVPVDSITTVRIGPQQTLWGVAQEHPIPGFSTAETVDIIVRMNDMDGGSLAVGQTLLVPTSDAVIDTAVAAR